MLFILIFDGELFQSAFAYLIKNMHAYWQITIVSIHIRYSNAKE